jgi:hypothetical protein
LNALHPPLGCCFPCFHKFRRFQKHLKWLPGTSYDNVRKAPHLIHWYMSLKLNIALGGDDKACMDTWDKKNALRESNRLKGPKRIAVEALLHHMPEEAVNIFYEHITEMGSLEESVFTDQTLSATSIRLGQGPACKSGEWTRRVRNTGKSIVLMAKMWTGERLTLKNGLRRKRSIPEVGKLACLAAFIQCMLEALEADQTIAHEHVVYIEKQAICMAAGFVHMCETAIQEQISTFNFMDLPCVQDIPRTSCSKTDEKVKKMAEDLEAAQQNLVQVHTAMADKDIEAWKDYLSSITDTKRNIKVQVRASKLAKKTTGTTRVTEIRETCVTIAQIGKKDDSEFTCQVNECIKARLATHLGMPLALVFIIDNHACEDFDQSLRRATTQMKMAKNISITVINFLWDVNGHWGTTLRTALCPKLTHCHTM